MRVFDDSTADPPAFTTIVKVVRDKFALEKMVMVGDRDMITSARIAALNQPEDDGTAPSPYDWITALRALAIKKLMAGDGPLQLNLFDEQDLTEITSEDFPGERPVAPARRSAAAQAKASHQHDSADRPYRSFRGLLAHLATLTRNQVRFADTSTTVPMLAEPTAGQRLAFDLIGAPIPLTLT